MKRQHIVHSYGEEELVDAAELQADLEERLRNGTVQHSMPAHCNRPENVDIILGGKKCKCGSTTHQRTSHRNCPLNKK